MLLKGDLASWAHLESPEVLLGWTHLREWKGESIGRWQKKDQRERAELFHLLRSPNADKQRCAASREWGIGRPGTGSLEWGNKLRSDTSVRWGGGVSGELNKDKVGEKTETVSRIECCEAHTLQQQHYQVCMTGLCPSALGHPFLPNSWHPWSWTPVGGEGFVERDLSGNTEGFVKSLKFWNSAEFNPARNSPCIK